jgi:hypothetical protein
VSEALLLELLPGPVTVVFDRKLNLNPELNPGTSLVGVRVPNCRFIRDICRYLQQPLALTSANISNQPSSLSVDVSMDSVLYCNKNQAELFKKQLVVFVSNNISECFCSEFIFEMAIWYNPV